MGRTYTKVGLRKYNLKSAGSKKVPQGRELPEERKGTFEKDIWTGTIKK